MKTEKILEKIEKLNSWEIKDFISSLDLTPEQMELLVDHENENVRYGLALNANLISKKVMIKLSNDENMWVRWVIASNPRLKITENVMILLSSDEYDDTKYQAFKKLEKLNTLSSDDLESAYDLINNSKHIGREHFEETFDFIIDEFPEVSKLAKMFKRIILKGKKDFK